MSPRIRSMTLMGVQLLIVLSLWGKLHYDRAKLPRYWVQAAPVDPDLPIRGRYLALEPVLPVHGFVFPGIPPRPKQLKASDPWPDPKETHLVSVKLQATDSGLVANALPDANSHDPNFYEPRLGPGVLRGRVREGERALQQDRRTVVLYENIPYFIPENAKNPAHLGTGETLWMEVTFPPKGPLRVIRLAVKDSQGTMRVLNL